VQASATAHHQEDKDAMDVDASTSCHELPDGTKIDYSYWFTDDIPFASSDTTSPSLLDEHSTLSNVPPHKLIHSFLSAVSDVDVRKILATNINAKYWQVVIRWNDRVLRGSEGIP
jgi:hypothetical protein